MKPSSATKWISKHEKISNSSAAHETVRQIFLTDTFFKQMRCWQEVPVSDLCDGYPTKRHHVDWYIESLGVVIELHGRQHYEAVDFGGEGPHVAGWRFRKATQRDNQKKEAIIEAGYSIVTIPYSTKITPETLKELVLGE